MKLRHLVAVAGIAALVLAGCGGGGDDGGSGGSQDPVSSEDAQAIVEVSSKLEEAAKAKDGKAICDLFQPALVEEAFGSKARCAKQAGRALAQPGLKDLEVDTLTPTDTGITATYKKAPGTEVPFVKIDGKWYVDISSTVAGDAVPSDD